MRYWTSGFGWSLLVAFFIIFFVMLQSAVTAYRTVSMDQAQQAFNQMVTEREKLTAVDIFINNLWSTWTLIIPIIGIFPFIVVMYNTGWLIGELSLVYNIYPTIVLQNLVVIGFVEILAYVILLGENIYFSTLTLTGGPYRERIPYVILSAILYLILLFVAAAIEIYIITGA